jgi:hypothetical protein
MQPLSQALRRQAVIRSPFPRDETASRLAAVTSRRGHRWFLDPGAAGTSAPLLRGSVTPALVHVARFPETLRRNSFVAWFDGRLQPTADGGTDISGVVGISRPVLRVSVLLIAANLLVLVPLLVTGLVLLVGRGETGAIALVLVPLAIVTFESLLVRAGLRFLRADEQRLRRLLEEILSRPAGPGAPSANEGL